MPPKYINHNIIHRILTLELSKATFFNWKEDRNDYDVLQVDGLLLNDSCSLCGPEFPCYNSCFFAPYCNYHSAVTSLEERRKSRTYKSLLSKMDHDLNSLGGHSSATFNGNESKIIECGRAVGKFC